MLTLINKKITSSVIIESYYSIITLTSDITTDIFGEISLVNGITRLCQFIHIKDNIYKARMLIHEEDIPLLATSQFNLILINGPFSERTNQISLNFDIDKIHLSIQVAQSKELKEIKLAVADLTSRIESLIKGYKLSGIPLSNQTNIKRGMVPVAIDDKGNFAAMYPFNDSITEINGQRAANGVVELDASMIKYIQERTIADQLTVIGEAFTKEHELVTKLSEEVKKLTDQLAELQIRFEVHLDNGVV